MMGISLAWMRPAAIACAVLGVGLSTGASVFAGAVYRADTDTLTLRNGTTGSVQISLELSGPELNWVNDPEKGAGLAYAAVRLIRESGHATIASPDAVTPNAVDFNEVPLAPQVDYVDAVNVGLFEGVDLYALAGAYMDVEGRVRLGTFEFTAPDFADVSVFRIVRYDSAGNMVMPFYPPLEEAGLQFDPVSDLSSAPSITITTTVPLPAALWAGMPVLLALGCRYAGRKGK